MSNKNNKAISRFNSIAKTIKGYFGSALVFGFGCCSVCGARSAQDQQYNQTINPLLQKSNQQAQTKIKNVCNVELSKLDIFKEQCNQYGYLNNECKGIWFDANSNPNHNTQPSS